MINNYRVNFGGSEIDYKDNFKDCRKYFPVLEKLYVLMADFGIQDSWHFFEPYVEFTWVVPQTMMDKMVVSPRGRREPITEAQSLLGWVLSILEEEGIEPALVHRPEDGVVVDWYCKNPKEQEFGYKTYALSAKMAMLFWEYREAIEQGLGEKKQYMRRPHILANQIGMNYSEEACALEQRAHLCVLFWEHGHEGAVRRYEEIYGEGAYL